MSPSDTPRRSVLTTAEADFALRLWFPILVLAVLMKGIRMTWTGEETIVQVIDGVRPEAMLYSGLGLASAGALALISRPGRRAVVSVLIGCFGVFLFFAETSGHTFFAISGTHVDAPVALFALAQVRDLWTVFIGEIPLAYYLVLLGGLTWIVLIYRSLPWRVPHSSGHMQRRTGWRTLALGAVAVVLALPAPIASPWNGATRDIPLHLLFSARKLGSRPPPHVDDPLVWRRAELAPRQDGARVWRNAVVIWLESTSWGATTLADPSLQTTPFLARLAENSLVATRAWTVVTHSTKATVPILCGTPPLLEHWGVESGEIPVPCLPGLLADRGYDTLMLRSATRNFENWPGVIRNLGFEEFVALEDLDGTGYEFVNYFGIEDDILLPRSQQFLDAHSETPFLTVYMTGAPHTDYRVPSDFPKQRFHADEVQNNYLNNVHYVDRFAEKVIAQFKAAGLYEDTVFVIVGDHGEAFGEHSRFQHDAVPYEEGAHVPLIVHAAGAFEGGVRVDSPTSHFDIVPTLATMMGFTLDAPGREGLSLLAPDPDRTVYLHCFYSQRCAALLRGTRKLVYHYGDRSTELFDLATDPHERHDLASANPTETAALEADLLAWVGRSGVLWKGTR